MIPCSQDVPHGSCVRTRYKIQAGHGYLVSGQFMICRRGKKRRGEERRGKKRRGEVKREEERSEEERREEKRRDVVW